MSIKEKIKLQGLNIALKASPDDIALLYERAITLYNLNKFDKALEDLDHMLEIITNYNAIHVKMHCLMIMERYEEALECYKQLSTMDPEFEDDLETLDDIYLNLRMHKERLPVVEKLLLLEGDNFLLLLDKANLLSKLNRKEESLVAIDKCINTIEDKSSVFYIIAHLHKAMVQRKLKRFEEALETYDKILGIDKSNHVALVGKGRALVGLSRYDEAREIADILRADSDNGGACIIEACECMKKGRLDETLQILDLIEDASYDVDEDASIMRIKILKSMDRLDDALEECDSFLESHIEIVEFEYGDFKVTKEFSLSEKISNLREEILSEIESQNTGESSK